MKAFLKVTGILLTVVLALKGIHALINYFYDTYAVRYAESEVDSKN